MKPEDEYAFLRCFAMAVRNSCPDVASLERLYRNYEDEIAKCSAAGQTELQRLRLAREKELKGKAA